MPLKTNFTLKEFLRLPGFFNSLVWCASLATLTLSHVPFLDAQKSLDAGITATVQLKGSLSEWKTQDLMIFMSQRGRKSDQPLLQMPADVTLQWESR